MRERQTPTHKPFLTLKQRMKCEDVVTSPVRPDTELGWYTDHNALGYTTTDLVADWPTCGFGVCFHYNGRKSLP